MKRIKLSRLSNRQLRRLLNHAEVRFADENIRNIGDTKKQNGFAWYKRLFRVKGECEALVRWANNITDSFNKAYYDIVPRFDLTKANWKYTVERNCELGSEALKPFNDLYAQWNKTITISDDFPQKIEQIAKKKIEECKRHIDYLEKTYPEFKTANIQRKFH